MRYVKELWTDRQTTMTIIHLASSTTDVKTILIGIS